MFSDANKKRLFTFNLLMFSIVAILLTFWLHGNKGFSLWDEGYLWYGVQRVMRGEIPILDFKSYDPGRYYWSAALMTLWGDNGILSLRASVAVFESIGLFIGILLIAKGIEKRDRFFVLLSALILLIWMFPRHKLFDISLPIFMVGALALLVQNPNLRRHFLAGVCLGIIAIFGRNHGLYGLLGTLGIFTLLSINNFKKNSHIKQFTYWAFGVCIGFSPILLAMLLKPGYFSAYWQSICYLFEKKATNIFLPIPWPWEIHFATHPLSVSITRMLLGLYFMLILLFTFASIAFIIHRRINNKSVSSVFAAASFLTLPYSHYFYSRADVSHLAQAIPPFLIGFLIFIYSLNNRIKYLILSCLIISGLFIHPSWKCFSTLQCENIEISNNHLQVSKGTANQIILLRRIVSRYAPDGENFIVTPLWPGAYAMFNRKCPLWASYSILPQSQNFQKNEIKQIKAAKPGFILIVDLPVDGRDDLRFRNTNPLVYKFIRRTYERTTSLVGNSDYLLFINRNNKSKNSAL